jgi:predicted ester cyclase
MGMQNFSPEFKTPEQYIIDITYKIWEESGVGRINEWYAADCPRRSPHGVTNTVADVVRETLETIALFPDGEILAEDVIIGDKPSGFYSSHRVRHVSTHLGEGYYGPATNQRITTLVIADCLCRDNKIVEEWEVSDQAGIVRQMGLDPVAFGRTLGERYPTDYSVGNEVMLKRWGNPQGLTIVGDKDIANRIIDTYTAIWNDKNLNIMSERYDRAVRFEGSDNHLIYGRSSMCKALTNILASIPDGNFEPYHVIVLQQPNSANRVALRWTYCGTHSGRGRYGEPTHSPVAMLGISHFELRDGLIAKEWLVIDETAIYAQISAHKMAKNTS